MTIQNAGSTLDNILSQALRQRTLNNNAPSPTSAPTPDNNAPQGQDIVALSRDNQVPFRSTQTQSQLVSERIQDTANGFRRTQEFENGQGRTFTRIEEVTTTEDRSRRVVIQQNDSGSSTALEDVFDRQEDGSFRLIQRFTDETGVTTANVTLDFNPEDANILLGRTPAATERISNPFQALRGTQVDLTA